MSSNPLTFRPLSVRHAYFDARELIEARRASARQSVKLAHNTYLTNLRNGEMVITYHGNPIIRMSSDGITLDSCGWRTFTTKERFNWFLPEGFRVCQEKKVWWVYGENHYRARFVDGMTLPVEED
jgi:hypothetical protein